MRSHCLLPRLKRFQPLPPQRNARCRPKATASPSQRSRLHTPHPPLPLYRPSLSHLTSRPLLTSPVPATISPTCSPPTAMTNIILHYTRARCFSALALSAQSESSRALTQARHPWTRPGASRALSSTPPAPPPPNDGAERPKRGFFDDLKVVAGICRAASRVSHIRSGGFQQRKAR